MWKAWHGLSTRNYKTNELFTSRQLAVFESSFVGWLTASWSTQAPDDDQDDNRFGVTVENKQPKPPGLAPRVAIHLRVIAAWQISIRNAAIRCKWLSAARRIKATLETELSEEVETIVRSKQHSPLLSNAVQEDASKTFQTHNAQNLLWKIPEDPLVNCDTQTLEIS